MPEAVIPAWIKRAVTEVAALPGEMAGIIGAVVRCPFHPMLTLDPAENKK